MNDQGPWHDPRQQPPPYGQQPMPPYPYQQPYAYQPPPMSPWVGYLVGALAIGPIAGVFLSIFMVMVLGSMGVESGAALLVGAVVVPTVMPVPLLFFKPTRPWGIGIMIGIALTSIVLGGVCVAIVSGH